MYRSHWKLIFIKKYLPKDIERLWLSGLDGHLKLNNPNIDPNIKANLSLNNSEFEI